MKPAVAQPRKLPDVVFFQEGPGLRNWQWTHGGMKIINGTNILPDGSINISNTDKFIAQSEFEGRYRHFAIDEGDIVLSSSGTLGKVGRITADHLPLMMNTSVIRFRTKDPSILDNGYLFAFLRSPQFQALIRTFAVGGVQQNFGPVHLKQIEMPVPALHQQQRIADILSAYDDLIENNRRRMALLDEAARQLYREWFVRLRFPGHEHTRITNRVPEGWERVPTPEAIEINPPTRLSDEAEHWSVQMADLPTDSMVIQQATKREGRSGSKFRNGDTLFARITPCLENGKTAFVDFLEDGEAGRGSTEFVVLRGKRVTPQYVYCLARTHDFRGNAIKSMVGSSGRQRVQESCFEKFLVLIPPSTLLTLFTDSVRPQFRQIKTLHAQNQKLRAARDLLLPRLMTGEIAV